MEDTFEPSPRIKKLLEKLTKDTQISEINLHDKAFLRASLASEWAGIYWGEMHRKKKMEEALNSMKDEVMQKKYEQKKSGGYFNETTLKLEVEKELRGNSQYQECKKILAEQDNVISFITEARQIIGQMGFDIKNTIECLKMENGG